jgi:putative hydrolase of the HAD superfamily
MTDGRDSLLTRNPTVSWIILDGSGVLTDEDAKATSRELSRQYGIDEQTIYDSVFETNYHLAYRGGLDNDTYYKNVVAETGLPLTYAEFVRAFLSHSLVRPGMEDMLRNLRKSGYRLGIISNQTPINTDYLHPILDPLVDIGIYSPEIWLSKPDPAIYRLMQEKLACDPAAVVFFDDRETNLVPAREIGWTCFLYTRDTDIPGRVAQVRKE